MKNFQIIIERNLIFDTLSFLFRDCCIARRACIRLHFPHIPPFPPEKPLRALFSRRFEKTSHRVRLGERFPPAAEIGSETFFRIKEVASIADPGPAPATGTIRLFFRGDAMPNVF